MEILNYKLFKLLKSIKDWRSLMDLIEFEKKSSLSVIWCKN